MQEQNVKYYWNLRDERKEKYFVRIFELGAIDCPFRMLNE